MFSTRRGTTSFCNVTEATVATPELGLEDRITFPVLPSRSMSACKHVGGGGGGGGGGGDGVCVLEREPKLFAILCD